MNNHYCAFIDDGKTVVDAVLQDKAERLIKKLIYSKVHSFIFYGLTDFSLLCLKILSKFKKFHPKIERFLIEDEQQICDKKMIYENMLFCSEIDNVCIAPDGFSINFTKHDKLMRMIEIFGRVVFCHDESDWDRELDEFFHFAKKVNRGYMYNLFYDLSF